MFSHLDVRFGRLMLRLSGTEDGSLFLAAALVSRAAGEGHVCVDLESIGGKPFTDAPGNPPERVLPKAETWRKTLSESPVVGDGTAFTPLVLDGAGRLYLYRLWKAETTCATHLLKRARSRYPTVSVHRFNDALGRLFPGGAGTFDDRQAAAAAVAATRRLCILSGGPGTGKTHTAAKIIALMLLLEIFPRPRIFLAAPTGKAAARLRESIRSVKDSLPISDALKIMIPEDAATLHRILGRIPGRPDFRFHENNPLPADLVIVDEASMVDLTMASALFKAVPESAGIVLMGDSHQLASVESGYVLGDICQGAFLAGKEKGAPNAEKTGAEISGKAPDAANDPKDGLSGCIVFLEKNYRFSDTSGIRQLSRAVVQGDGDAVMEILRSGAFDDLQWVGTNPSKEWESSLSGAIVKGFGPCVNARDPGQALKALEGFRMLSAVNHGTFGVTGLNAFAETLLRRRGWIPGGRQRYAAGYPGRPILITRNLHELRLFNGDTGVIWRATDGGLYAVFPEEDGECRRVAIPRLPEHETAYAVTVHKAQGSEFDEVLLILPEQDTPLLTRELLYTGITRARHRLILYAGEGAIRRAVSRRIQRRSGLKDALWGSGT
ncbi:MAG: exodeoxyribonuclease V subunit alpha [Deltaproteobacteria bacterium]|nr:exodeoxyribonuclease V subunit alpha [Deltaproteobacteria bacterium]